MDYLTNEQVDEYLRQAEIDDFEYGVGFKAGLIWMSKYSQIQLSVESFDRFLQRDLSENIPELVQAESQYPSAHSNFGTELAMAILGEDDPKAAVKFWDFHFDIPASELEIARECLMFYIGFFEAVKKVWAKSKPMLQDEGLIDPD